MPRPIPLPRARLLRQCLHQSSIHSSIHRPSHPPPLPTSSIVYPRHAFSSSLTGKPPTLEKPTRYNPPSHPTRINQPPSAPPRNYPGPPPDPTNKSPPRKRYPNTFPEDGSFMHWFLTTRWIHLCITLGTLITLGAITFHYEFHRKSPYANMLPPASDLLWHPISFLSTYIRAFKLDVDHTSAVTAQRRKKKVDDVVKRNEYRKAHGLDNKEGFGGWTTREGIAVDDKKESASSMMVTEKEEKGIMEGENEIREGKERREKEEGIVVEEEDEKQETAEQREHRIRQRVYHDAEGNKRPLKMWLGIW